MASEILDDLRWRGLLALTTDEEALDRALSASPVTFYCGFDPTAPSLHAGDPSVGEHLRRLIDRAVSEPRVVWRSVGEVVSSSPMVV